jgi:hypothetical protein
MAALLVALALSAVARGPLAEAIAVRPASERCLSAAALAASIGRWLGADEIEPGLVVEVIVPTPVGSVASYRLRRGSVTVAERSFTTLPADCPSRLEGVSLAIALALDPTLFERMKDPAAPSPPPSAATEPAAPEAPARGRTGVFAGASVYLGLLPRAALGLSLGAQHRLGEAVELRLSVLGTSAPSEPLGPGTVEARLVAAQLDACLGPAWRRARVHGCLGGVAGVLQARGSGFDVGLRGQPPFLAAAAGLSLELPVGEKLSLRLKLEGLIPAQRRTFRVTDTTGAVLAERTLPPASASAALQMVVRWE